MPRLKLMVEDVLHKYLVGEITDEEFKEGTRIILEEFEGKRLLHQNIGQLVHTMEKENSNRRHEFEKIWALLSQVNPHIREDLVKRLRRGPI
jgi:hypothetical protein